MNLSTSDLITIGIAVFTAWITTQRKLSRLETLMGRAIKDINGIAEFVGTPTALARKKETENEVLELASEKVGSEEDSDPNFNLTKEKI